MNVGLLLTMASTATTRYASAQCATPTHLAPNDTLPPTVLDGTTSRQRIKVVAVVGARPSPSRLHLAATMERSGPAYNPWDLTAEGTAECSTAMNVGLLLTMASTATSRYASAQCATPTHLAPNDTLPPTALDGTASRQRIKVVAVEHASRGARLPPPGAHGGPSPWRAFTWRRT